jgi:chromosome segregation ATPase
MLLDDVKRKYRSQSQLYEAFRIFSEEMHKRLNDMRENLRKIQEKLSEKNTEFQRVQSEWTKVDDEVAKLRREKQDLAGEVANMTKKRDGLRLEVTGLVKKGFSPKILEELKSVEARSGQELLARVKTAEKYDQLS